MTDRVDLLEERVAALATAVATLEARLAGLERGSELVARAREEPEEPDAPEPAGPRPASPRSPRSPGTAPMALAGRAFLGIGGAYLFRALTEAGTLAASRRRRARPGLRGRVAPRGGVERPVRAAERTPRFTRSCLSPWRSRSSGRRRCGCRPCRRSRRPRSSSAIGAAVFTVAWRHDLASVAWAATLGAVGTAWGLLLATTRIELFTLLLIAFGAATLWATYGRRWHGLRWPAALAADLAVLDARLPRQPDGRSRPRPTPGSRPGRSVFVALLLFVVYAGSFAARTLVRRRDVNVFEVFQTAAVLVAGYGGAVRLSNAAGTGQATLGVAALVLSALGYAAAFGFVERDAAGGRNFLFFSSLGLVLALTGGGLLASGPALAFAWILFGLAAALLGARFGRRSLVAHGALYLVAACFPSGLLGAAVSAFSRSGAAVAVRMGAAAASVALVAAVSWILTARSRREEPSGAGSRLAALALLAVAAAGAGSAAVEALVAVLPPGSAVPARTAVLAVAAVGLAALRVGTGVEEAGLAGVGRPWRNGPQALRAGPSSGAPRFALRGVRPLRAGAPRRVEAREAGELVDNPTGRPREGRAGPRREERDHACQGLGDRRACAARATISGRERFQLRLQRVRRPLRRGPRPLRLSLLRALPGPGRIRRAASSGSSSPSDHLPRRWPDAPLSSPEGARCLPAGPRAEVLLLLRRRRNAAPPGAAPARSARDAASLPEGRHAQSLGVDQGPRLAPRRRQGDRVRLRDRCRGLDRKRRDGARRGRRGGRHPDGRLRPGDGATGQAGPDGELRGDARPGRGDVRPGLRALASRPARASAGTTGTPPSTRLPSRERRRPRSRSRGTSRRRRRTSSSSRQGTA